MSTQYSSVPFCDPSISHAQFGHLPNSCSFLPHRACFSQERSKHSPPRLPMQTPRIPSAPASYHLKTQHRNDFQRSTGREPTRRSASRVPSRNGSRDTYRIPVRNGTPISGTKLNELLIHQPLQKQAVNEDTTMEEAHLDFNALQCAEHDRFLGQPRQHNPQVSAPLPRPVCPIYSNTLAVAQTRGAGACTPSHAVTVPTSTPPGMQRAVLQPSPTIFSTPSNPPACRVRRPTASSGKLSLFPPPSPTNSLESNKPLSSPTTSLRPSIYLQQHVSVFEDNDERSGLMDYLKHPFQASRMDGLLDWARSHKSLPNRAQRKRRWRQLLCLCTGRKG